MKTILRALLGEAAPPGKHPAPNSRKIETSATNIFKSRRHSVGTVKLDQAYLHWQHVGRTEKTIKLTNGSHPEFAVVVRPA